MWVQLWSDNKGESEALFNQGLRGEKLVTFL